MAANGFAGQILYSGPGNNGSQPGSGTLVTINQATGAGTQVGSPTTGGITGLVFTSTGALYATTSTPNGATSNLEQLNPATGAALSNISLNIQVGDLADQPVTDVLYAITGGHTGAGVLYTVSPKGVTTLIGDTGTGKNGGLAFAPNGTLYMTSFGPDGDDLYTLNSSTGQILTTVATTNFFDGLAVRPSDGLLFANSGTVDEIYTINPSTGAATLLGPVGFANAKPSDLAFLVTPEPASWMLMAVGLAGLFWAALRVRRAAPATTR